MEPIQAPVGPGRPQRQVLGVSPLHTSLNLPLRDTVRIGGSGFEPGMTVRFGFESFRRDTAKFLGLSDTLLSVLPPQPKQRTAVEIWVYWPKAPGAGVARDSLRAPDMFAFVGPDPANPLVYDYEWHAQSGYRPVRFRLSDAELPIWIDDAYPAEYEREIRRAFDKWEDTIEPGKPRFRQVENKEEAKIWVRNAVRAGGAFAFLNDDDTELLGVEVHLLLLLDQPPLPPPRNYFLTGVHEVGHALGIWSHSPYRGDVVGLFGDESLPSERDIATLRHLYSRASAITD